MLADLQVHTIAGSPDSILDPVELPAACSAMDLDAVATTEHTRYDLDAMAGVFEGSGVLWLPAREVAWDGRHILVLTANLQKLDDLPVAFARDELPHDDQDLAFIWAHPAAIGGSSAYGPQRPPLPDSGKLHGVEVLNGRHLHFTSAVDIAMQIVEDMQIPATAGSDAHDLSAVGRCATEIRATQGFDARSVVSALRAGMARPILNPAWAKAHDYDYRDSLARFMR